MSVLIATAYLVAYTKADGAGSNGENSCAIPKGSPCLENACCEGFYCALEVGGVTSCEPIPSWAPILEMPQPPIMQRAKTRGGCMCKSLWRPLELLHSTGRHASSTCFKREFAQVHHCGMTSPCNADGCNSDWPTWCEIEDGCRPDPMPHEAPDIWNWKYDYCSNASTFASDGKEMLKECTLPLGSPTAAPTTFDGNYTLIYAQLLSTNHTLTVGEIPYSYHATLKSAFLTELQFRAFPTDAIRSITVAKGTSLIEISVHTAQSAQLAQLLGWTVRFYMQDMLMTIGLPHDGSRSVSTLNPEEIPGTSSAAMSSEANSITLVVLVITAIIAVVVLAYTVAQCKKKRLNPAVEQKEGVVRLPIHTSDLHSEQDCHSVEQGAVDIVDYQRTMRIDSAGSFENPVRGPPSFTDSIGTTLRDEFEERFKTQRNVIPRGDRAKKENHNTVRHRDNTVDDYLNSPKAAGQYSGPDDTGQTTSALSKKLLTSSSVVSAEYESWVSVMSRAQLSTDAGNNYEEENIQARPMLVGRNSSSTDNAEFYDNMTEVDAMEALSGENCKRSKPRVRFAEQVNGGLAQN